MNTSHKHVFKLTLTGCILLFAAVTFISSCKKTIGLDPLPQNKILEYKVTNIQDTVIYGAIDNIENTITVYVPYYYSVGLIDPKIKLESGAKLSSEVLPVNVNDVSQTYTVKGSDGSSRVYKLTIKLQNPLSLTVNYQGISPTATEFLSYPNQQISLEGDFNSINTATLRITLTERLTKKEIPVDISKAVISTNVSNYILQVVTPAELDSGYYDVKVNFLGNENKISKPLHITYKAPLAQAGLNTVTQGGTLTLKISGNNGQVFLGLNKVTVTIAGKDYDFPVESANRMEAVVRLPDNVPVGPLGFLPFKLQFKDWPSVVTQSIGLTVNPK